MLFPEHNIYLIEILVSECPGNLQPIYEEMKYILHVLLFIDLLLIHAVCYLTIAWCPGCKEGEKQLKYVATLLPPLLSVVAAPVPKS